MQQISVKLWSYNPKMILQRFGRPPTMDHPLNVFDISLINIVLLLLFLNLFVYCRVSLLSLFVTKFLLQIFILFVLLLLS